MNRYLRDRAPKINKKAASKISMGPFKQFNPISRISQHFKASAPTLSGYCVLFKSPKQV